MYGLSFNLLEIEFNPISKIQGIIGVVFRTPSSFH